MAHQDSSYRTLGYAASGWVIGLFKVIGILLGIFLINLWVFTNQEHTGPDVQGPDTENINNNNQNYYRGWQITETRRKLQEIGRDLAGHNPPP
jgi:hypothetical protein